MWNTYDLPAPMGAMWIVISPAPGLSCLSTIVQADFGKTTSVQVPVPVSEYGPVIEKSIPYWVLEALLMLTVNPERLVVTGPVATMPFSATDCRLAPRLSLMLAVAVSVVPPIALAENAIEILHFLVGAMVCSEHESLVELKSPASGPAKEVWPKVMDDVPMLVTRTDFAALVTYCGTLNKSVVGETEIWAEAAAVVNDASSKAARKAEPVTADLDESFLFVIRSFLLLTEIIRRTTSRKREQWGSPFCF
jgi:hypothetical protein